MASDVELPNASQQRTETPRADWWPRGVNEQLVRDCNCEYCGALLEALEEFRSGRAPGRDGDATLAAFA